ncbi:hypothetical protein RSW49_22775 [Escherichia coli]|uniref:hypothetical protein n=1 Tax=Escherichia coli TaxID=562 RepID=UPI0028DF420E|nr:hypothetical protein [Escherichia coli]MDT9105775.1 hypothetical protein [Escherichia coli]
MTTPEIISRAEAKARGLKRYFTGGTCLNGHTSERMASSGNCIECSRSHDADRRKRDDRREYMREYNAKYHAENTEKIRENKNRWQQDNKEKKREYNSRWRQKNLEAVREKEAAYRIANPEVRRDTMKRYRATIIAEISKGYVATALKMHVGEISDDLYALKRQQLEIHRLEAELKRSIKELTNEQ